MSDMGNTTKELSPLKRAFLKIEEMEAKLAATENAKREPIAIVGLACRLPHGIHEPEAFWQLLREGIDAVQEFPRDRWNVEDYYDADPNAPGKMATKWGAFLAEVDKFDAQLFGISPREAAGLDPQQRLLLEVAWQALEHAGQAPDKLMHSATGVFLAMCKVDYAQLIVQQNDPTLLDAYYASGNAYSTAAGRISYVLGLQGPCMTIDTACSSSLVAVHLACQSLRNGESNMALAGGVNLVLSPNNTITFSKSNMLATDGRCKTFDAAADGFVQGEGCGMVVLKRLADAIAQGDNILAVIRGTAINQDGASSGLTAPSGPAQEAVIRAALANAGLPPEAVSYVETHGTGTALGDPIEVQAIGAALGVARTKENPVLLGAVKTNLGHLEGAAGMAGLIKVVLALQHAQIPATLHFKNPNPFIPWHALPVEVVTQLRPWPESQTVRTAGVSSFGFSGTNAHLVIQEAKKDNEEKEPTIQRRHVLALSAKSEAALQKLAQRYAQHIALHPEHTLVELCYNANTSRAQLAQRLAIAAETKDELRAKLSAFANGQTLAHVHRGFVATEDSPKVAFLFTGQGAQYIEMGRELYETQPVFRAAMDRCDELLRPHLEAPLLSVIYPHHSPVEGGIADSNEQRATSNQQPAINNRLDQTAYTQPALFAVEYALAQLWQAWGIVPNAVMGHSVGEFVAACIAGVLSLEDALRLVAARGRLMQALPTNGAMAAVFAARERVAAALANYADTVAIAAYNGPEHVVISGERAAVREICAHLEKEGVKHKPLTTSHAFHSPLLEPMLEEFAQVASTITHHTPRLTFISNLTGKAFDFRFKASEPQSAIHNPQSYWREHARAAVQFEASMHTLYEKGYRHFLEVGPQAVLLGMASKCLPDAECVWLPSLRKGKADLQQMLDSLSGLYVNGVPPDWNGFYSARKPRKIVLPTYPFQRRRFWFDDERGVKNVDSGALMVDRVSHSRATIHHSSSTASQPLHGARLHTPLLREVIFEKQLSIASTPFIAEHRVHETVVLPTTAYLEMIGAAAEQAFGAGTHALEDMDIREALTLHGEETRTVQLMFTPEHETQYRFEVISFAAAEQNGTTAFKTHASGKLRLVHAFAASVAQPQVLAALRAQCREEIAHEQFYEVLAARGLKFGPRFHGVTQLWRDEHNALGAIQATAAITHEAQHYRIHPALLDACLQVAAAELVGSNSAEIFMPIGLESFRLFAPVPQQLWSHCKAKRQKDNEPKSQNRGETRTVDFYIYSSEGRMVAELLGLQMKRVRPDHLQRAAATNFHDWLYEVRWEPQPLPQTVAGNAVVDYVPATRDFAALTSSYIQHLSTQHGFQIYDAMLPHLDALSVAYTLAAFETLGWKFTLGQRGTTAQLAMQFGVIPRQQRLLQRLLAILAEAGILQREGESWSVSRVPEPIAIVDLAQSFLLKFPTQRAEFDLLQRGGQNLAAVLRGEFDPLQVLFPGGSFAVAEKLYDESLSARVYNGVMRGIVQELVAHLPHDRKLRVLEVGAGTGGTPSFILQDFPRERTEYYFTDLSPLFLARAQEKFKAFPFVHYALLDLEKDPLAQGFAAHSFDLVIGANVVHATKDLRETLRHIKRVLAPEGVLMLAEGMMPQGWIDLTFGMTDGWWRFTDVELRDSYPLLAQKQWQALLESEGFTQFAATPRDLNCGRALAQNAVLLARGPRFVQHTAAATEKGRWLILRDDNGLAEKLATHLEQAGDEVVFARLAETFQILAPAHYGVAPTRTEDFKQLLQAAFGANEIACRGVINFWPCDDLPTGEYTFEQICHMQDRGARSVLALTQALLAAENISARNLWLITRNAQPCGAAPAPLDFAQAPLWGMSRGLVLEHPELRCVRVDLGPYDDIGNVQQLAQEILAPNEEDQIAYRSGLRYVARLSRVKIDERGLGIEDGRLKIVDRERESMINDQQSTILDPRSSILNDDTVQLEITKRGTLDGLALQPAIRRAPEANEIEIRVRATGLNFRDVLNVLGMREDNDPLGGEVAGTVVRVGSSVHDFKIGDDVIAIIAGGFSSYVTTDTTLVLPKPETMSFAEAATVPLAFLTAHYALHVVGKLQAGERILIHAAAGGVGLAAVHIALRAGAEVYATAGSTEKREYLQRLGVKHVYHSRNLDFAEEIAGAFREERGARIVDSRLRIEDRGSNSENDDLQSTIFDPQSSNLDLVLNSLTGEFIPRSMRLLRAGGRFLEIGKKEILSANQAAAIHPQAGYYAIDLAEKIKRNPHEVRPLFVDLLEAMQRDELQPLPHTAFTLQEASSAFRYMAQAKHLGKVVVTQFAVNSDRLSVSSIERQASSIQHPVSSIKLQTDATYLITGGLTGIGLLTAQWLVENGARHLVLMGRRAASEEAQRVIAGLEERGAEVFALQGDVAKAEDVTRILAEINQAMPLLRGIIHSAGVLDDGVLLQQTWERYTNVLAPKAYGAWHLHALTKHMPLDFFVIYSSISALLGSPAQTNHSAANAFLDALAHHRRALGLPAMSINWGAWSEVGAAARHNIGDRIALRGIHTFTPQQGLHVLAALFAHPVTQVGVIPVDWATFSGVFAGKKTPPYFSALMKTSRPQSAAVASANNAPSEMLQELRASLPAKRQKLLLQYVETQALKVLSMDATQTIHEKQPLTDIGLDSLMAVELRNLLGTGLGLPRALPATLVFDYPTTSAIAGYLAKELFGEESAAAATVSKPEKTDAASMVEQLEELSEEEIERLFAEKMGAK